MFPPYQPSQFVCANGVPRSFNNGRAHFHGMIKWLPKAKQLHLIQDLKTQAKTVFVFDKSGTAATNQDCRRLELLFIQQYGGPLARQQWGVSGRAHQHMWEAANAVWGYARKQ
jgi:hypothetical protein